MPLSKGCTTLVRPFGMILPVATATISTLPMLAHKSARQNTAMMLAAIARPTGDGGISTISSAAGRKASSSLRCSARSGVATTRKALAGFMQPCLEPVQRCIAAARDNELLVRPVLHEAAALERQKPVRAAHRGQPVRDHDDRAATRDPPHVGLDDPLAFIVERAGGLIEDQDARVGDQR